MSPWLSPSAVSFCWFDVDLEVATSGRSLMRTEVSFGSALACSSSRSRAARNCSRLIPLLFWSCMVKPLDWPSPRIAPGTSANTCASRKPRNAPEARSTIASAVFSLPGRSSQSAEVDEALPGVLADRAAAAAAAGDGEQRLDVLRFSCSAK